MANSAKEIFKNKLRQLRQNKKTLARERAEGPGEGSYFAHNRRLDFLRRDVEDAERNLGQDRISYGKAPLPGSQALADKEAERVRPQPYGNRENWKNAVMKHPIASKIFAGVEPGESLRHTGAMRFQKRDKDGFTHSLEIMPNENDSTKFTVGVNALDSKHKYAPFVITSHDAYGDHADLSKAIDAAYKRHNERNVETRKYQNPPRTFDYDVSNKIEEQKSSTYDNQAGWHPSLMYSKETNDHKQKNWEHAMAAMHSIGASQLTSDPKKKAAFEKDAAAHRKQAAFHAKEFNKGAHKTYDELRKHPDPEIRKRMQRFTFHPIGDNGI